VRFGLQRRGQNVGVLGVRQPRAGRQEVGIAADHRVFEGFLHGAAVAERLVGGVGHALGREDPVDRPLGLVEDLVRPAEGKNSASASVRRRLREATPAREQASTRAVKRFANTS